MPPGRQLNEQEVLEQGERASILPARPLRGRGQSFGQPGLLIAASQVDLGLRQALHPAQIDPFETTPIEDGTGEQSAREIGPEKQSARHDGAGQVCASEFGVGKVVPVKIAVRKISAGEIGADQAYSLEFDFDQPRFAEIGPVEVSTAGEGFLKIGAREISIAERRAHKLTPLQIGSHELRRPHAGSRQEGAFEICTREIATLKHQPFFGAACPINTRIGLVVTFGQRRGIAGGITQDGKDECRAPLS